MLLRWKWLHIGDEKSPLLRNPFNLLIRYEAVKFHCLGKGIWGKTVKNKVWKEQVATFEL
jgi:hypothetical protein